MNSLLDDDIDDEPYTPAGFANFDEERIKKECIADSAISEYYTEGKWDRPINESSGNSQFTELAPPNNNIQEVKSEDALKFEETSQNSSCDLSHAPIYTSLQPHMMVPTSQFQISPQNSSLMRMIPPNVDPNLLPAFLKPPPVSLPLQMPPSAMPHTVPHMMPGVVMLSHGILPHVAMPRVHLMPVPHKELAKNRRERTVCDRAKRKMEAMARVKAEKEARRVQKVQERRMLAEEKKKREVEMSEYEEEPSKKFMVLTKDTFVIRLRDVDSFSRNNEIWRIDNHVLIQKFTGVPSLRAPARQFQSTNRMSGYDMRATWRFYIIDSDKVEYDRYSAEITVHDFPSITDLREAKKIAEIRDEEFKDVEMDEYREKIMQLEEKLEERKQAKLRKRLERAQKREARTKRVETNSARNENVNDEVKKQYKSSKKMNWFPRKSSRASSDSESSQNDRCIIRDLLNSIVHQVAGSQKDEKSENEDDINNDEDEDVEDEFESDEHEQNLSDTDESDEEVPRTTGKRKRNEDIPLEVKYEVFESYEVPEVAFEMTI